MIRGIRGATTAQSNSRDAILGATQELLQIMIDRNGLIEEDVASVLFTTTPELNETFPALAARMMAGARVALLGFQEANVTGWLAPVHSRHDSLEYREVYRRNSPCLHSWRGDVASRFDSHIRSGGRAMTASFRARHLAIVGLGLMGGSLALAMRDHADFITGIDPDEGARSQALARSMVDCATDDLFEGVNRADVVLLATPVRVIVEMLEMLIGSYLRSNTLVIDIGSTKQDIVDAMAKLPIGGQRGWGASDGWQGKRRH